MVVSMGQNGAFFGLRKDLGFVTNVANRFVIFRQLPASCTLHEYIQCMQYCVVRMCFCVIHKIDAQVLRTRCVPLF